MARSKVAMLSLWRRRLSRMLPRLLRASGKSLWSSKARRNAEAASSYSPKALSTLPLVNCTWAFWGSKASARSLHCWAPWSWWSSSSSWARLEQVSAASEALAGSLGGACSRAASKAAFAPARSPCCLRASPRLFQASANCGCRARERSRASRDSGQRWKRPRASAR